jgi:hypothetical protein
MCLDRALFSCAAPQLEWLLWFRLLHPTSRPIKGEFISALSGDATKATGNHFKLNKNAKTHRTAAKLITNSREFSVADV